MFCIMVQSETNISVSRNFIASRDIFFRPSFFYFLIYEKIFKMLESGGRNKNKNKNSKIKESKKKKKKELNNIFFFF